MAGTRLYMKLLLSWTLATWHIEAFTSPIIQFEPEQPVFIVGERFTIRCVAANPSTITGYTFYKDSAVISNMTSSNILTMNLKTSDSGIYFCIYFMENGKKSLESMVINLRVFEQPPAPLLFVIPQRKVFIKDQAVVLRCQLPEGQSSAVTGITLYQNLRETYESDNFGVLNYTKVQIRNSGNYSCGYKTDLSGRTIQSYRSKEDSLIVIEQLPVPRLRYAINLQNKQVQLACDIQNPSFSQIHGYHFYENGIQIASSNQVNHFTFKYTPIFDGCYSCQTFVTILGEEIRSGKSLEHFLSLEGGDERLCQENISKVHILTKQGLKFYGSILAGKLLVLISVLTIFGVYLLVNQQRNLKPEEVINR